MPQLTNIMTYSLNLPSRSIQWKVNSVAYVCGAGMNWPSLSLLDFTWELWMEVHSQYWANPQNTSEIHFHLHHIICYWIICIFMRSNFALAYKEGKNNPATWGDEVSPVCEAHLSQVFSSGNVKWPHYECSYSQPLHIYYFAQPSKIILVFFLFCFVPI